MSFMENYSSSQKVIEIVTMTQFFPKNRKGKITQSTVFPPKTDLSKSVGRSRNNKTKVMLLSFQ